MSNENNTLKDTSDLKKLSESDETFNAYVASIEKEISEKETLVNYLSNFNNKYNNIHLNANDLKIIIASLKK